MNVFKSVFLPIIGVCLFIVVVGLASQGKLGFLLPNKTPIPNPNSEIAPETLKINDVSINIEVAKTNEERAKGLSNREKLDENSGMIFILDQNSFAKFWMKDTKIPLDMIWINDNKIIGITKDIQPELGRENSQLTVYPSPSAVDFVLEVNAGFSDKNGFKVGQTIYGLEQL